MNNVLFSSIVGTLAAGPRWFGFNQLRTALRNNNIDRLVLVSSASQYDVDNFVQQYKTIFKFKNITGYSIKKEPTTLQNNADILYKECLRANVPPEDCLFIGNTDEDRLQAEALGTPFLNINTPTAESVFCLWAGIHSHIAL